MEKCERVWVFWCNLFIVWVVWTAMCWGNTMSLCYEQCAWLYVLAHVHTTNKAILVHIHCQMLMYIVQVCCCCCINTTRERSYTRIERFISPHAHTTKWTTKKTSWTILYYNFVLSLTWKIRKTKIKFSYMYKIRRTDSMTFHSEMFTNAMDKALAVISLLARIWLGCLFFAEVSHTKCYFVWHIC